MLVASGALVGLAGAGIGIAISAGGDGTTPAATEQVASIRDGCSQWVDDRTDDPVDPEWCVRMTDWMRERLDDHGMGPQMMWGDADDLRATCRRWATTTADPDDWCDDMVGWMEEHMGSWGDRDSEHGWMMR